MLYQKHGQERRNGSELACEYDASTNAIISSKTCEDARLSALNEVDGDRHYPILHRLWGQLYTLNTFSPTREAVMMSLTQQLNTWQDAAQAAKLRPKNLLQVSKSSGSCRC